MTFLPITQVVTETMSLAWIGFFIKPSRALEKSPTNMNPLKKTLSGEEGVLVATVADSIAMVSVDQDAPIDLREEEGHTEEEDHEMTDVVEEETKAPGSV